MKHPLLGLLPCRAHTCEPAPHNKEQPATQQTRPRDCGTAYEACSSAAGPREARCWVHAQAHAAACLCTTGHPRPQPCQTTPKGCLCRNPSERNRPGHRQAGTAHAGAQAKPLAAAACCCVGSATAAAAGPRSGSGSLCCAATSVTQPTPTPLLLHLQSRLPGTHIHTPNTHTSGNGRKD